MKQAKIHAQGERADDRAPHEVARMHLPEQCKHEQPWHGERDEEFRIAIAQVPRGGECAEREQEEAGEPERELQRERGMRPGEIKLPEFVIQAPARFDKERGRSYQTGGSASLGELSSLRQKPSCNHAEVAVAEPAGQPQ